ncbi:MAG: hypothetical protein DMF78_18460 [Acidobacteria bacterium]|nr:MAG: hypothetical protein DMF78_18460 [Acidobacteriota bacterium]
MRHVLATAVVAAGLACSGPAPPSGLDTPRPGIYAGPIHDSKGAGGDGIATLSLETTGPTVSGTWLIDLSNGAYRRDGFLRGEAVGGHVNLVLLPAKATDCTFGIQAVTGTDDRISGTFASVSCTAAFGGSLELRRQ